MGHPVVEISTTHTIRHTHPIGLLGTSDQLFTEAATYTKNTRDKHPCPQ
jgi:hypothetical protein